jgi:hypothetical protein
MLSCEPRHSQERVLTVWIFKNGIISIVATNVKCKNGFVLGKTFQEKISEEELNRPLIM